MTDQLNKESRNIEQPTTAESVLADAAEDPILSAITEPKKTPDTLSTIEENQLLRYKVRQLEKNQHQAILEYNQAQELKPYQAELIQLQQCLEKRGKKVVIIFEGRGGAGKGSAIRHITQYMNVKHFRVVALGKPTAEERSQWFYQKYIREFPNAGDLVLFYRSWYSRALIEPVFNFCTEQEYKEFNEGVHGFERDLVNQNIILIKLYFSVSKEERARRFEQRKDDPLQRWTLNEVDLEAEEHREEFTEAKYKMLRHTHTMHAPWTIIQSDSKHQACLNAIKVILNAVDYERLNLELDFVPDPSVVISGSYELERMEAQRLRRGKKLEPLAACCGSNEI